MIKETEVNDSSLKNSQLFGQLMSEQEKNTNYIKAILANLNKDKEEDDNHIDNLLNLKNLNPEEKKS